MEEEIEMTFLEEGSVGRGTKALITSVPFDPAGPLSRTDPKEKSRYIRKDVWLRMAIKTLLIMLKITQLLYLLIGE